ncbi:MAG: Dna2/Cas4 domain-containing protein [Burkholderiaceae bacterium]|jgi:CRISPR/Cas system-associated exonuclease Cas4 (RecB family)|nr:Dna2/Cas4 domain-containing protein [Burkholderiaceae bacterium]MEB2350418.1 Dna2/Cas4 domain-containing protein [Burkholderiaceae bacterium]
MNVDLEAASAAGEPDIQASLPLDAPPLPPGVPLIPVRMVNEYVYCPRLAYLEWVQGEWAESADTVEGRQVHRRVDKRSGKAPVTDDSGLPDAAGERVHVRSLELSSDALGLRIGTSFQINDMHALA